MEWRPPDNDSGFLPAGPTLEKRDMPRGRAFLRKDIKREFKRVGQQKELAKIVPALPGPGCSIHVMGNGKYDFYNWVPHVCQLIGEPAAGYFSTWTMSRDVALDLLALYDTGALSAVTVLTGIYFKRRETAVYATITEGLTERGQRYMAFLNHAKLILLHGGGYYLTVEGSANFTSNPRWEQYVISNDRGLFEFHTDWIEKLGWADG